MFQLSSKTSGSDCCYMAATNQTEMIRLHAYEHLAHPFA